MKKKTRLQSFNIGNHNKGTIWEKFTNDYFIVVKDSGETRNFKNWNQVILQFTTIYILVHLQYTCKIDNLYWGPLDIAARFKEWKVKNLICIKSNDRTSHANLVMQGFGVAKISLYHNVFKRKSYTVTIRKDDIKWYEMYMRFISRKWIIQHLMNMSHLGKYLAPINGVKYAL